MIDIFVFKHLPLFQILTGLVCIQGLWPRDVAQGGLILKMVSLYLWLWTRYFVGNFLQVFKQLVFSRVYNILQVFKQWIFVKLFNLWQVCKQQICAKVCNFAFFEESASSNFFFASHQGTIFFQDGQFFFCRFASNKFVQKFASNKFARKFASF